MPTVGRRAGNVHAPGIATGWKGIRIGLIMLFGIVLAGCDVVGALPVSTPTLRLPPATQSTPIEPVEPASESRHDERVPSPTQTMASLTRTPEETPAGTPTKTPWPTPTTPCYRADFLQDVRIIDGTRFDPGDILFKTWRIQNSGTCDWHGDITLHFLAGDRLARPTDLPAMFYQVGAQLEPRLDELNWADLRLIRVGAGQQVDLVAFFRAPDLEGEYRSLWQLTGPEGQPLGQVYLYIRVRSSYEFTPESWSGLWRHLPPEQGAVESELALQQQDRLLRGYFYRQDGVPQLIEGAVSLDGKRVEGAVGEPWSDGAVFFLEQMTAGYRFKGRLESGPFAEVAWCGARGTLEIPVSSCLLEK
ncbi:MAG: NBR1-Ig-like domain-containing protein [Anaerolineales bacterium]